MKDLDFSRGPHRPLRTKQDSAEEIAMTEQVMGRIHHTENGVVCALNSVGQQLPDDTKLYAHPAEHKETDAESRAAWIAVVLQKWPTAEIRVVGDVADAKVFNGMVVGNWTAVAWKVK